MKDWIRVFSVQNIKHAISNSIIITANIGIKLISDKKLETSAALLISKSTPTFFSSLLIMLSDMKFSVLFQEERNPPAESFLIITKLHD